MTPLSGVKRTKQCRVKNKTRVREEDALRKRHMRMKMKVIDPVKNEEGLRKQRLFFTHFISIWLDNSSNTKYWSN